MNRLVSSILILIFWGGLAFAVEKKEIGNKPTYRFSGDAQLLTHFIERGLSITDGNPGLNASFLFNMGQQFRIGFWGTNVSNVTSSDDNLWLKFIADINIEFSSDSIFMAYFHNNNYYKSDLRNGQAFGMTYNIKSYMTQVEWLTNYQGTGTAAFYLSVGKIFPLYKKILPGIFLGYTVQNSSGYLNYFNVKATANYTLTSSFDLEGGITAVTNSTQFGRRGDPAIYLAIKLNY